MIVCLCRGVSEATLQMLIERGARTARQVADVCGAGMDCGACSVTVTELLESAASRRRESPYVSLTELHR